MLIVATFLEALSRVATSGDPQNPTAPGMRIAEAHEVKVMLFCY